LSYYAIVEADLNYQQLPLVSQEHSMNKEDVEELITKLISVYPPSSRKLVEKIARAANATCEERLKSKDLKKIIRLLAKDWKASRKKNIKDSTEPMHISKLMSWKCESKWLIKDLLPESGITILSGDPGNFKTWSTLHFALCVAEGKLAYNHFETVKASVLIIDEEDNISLLQQRLKTLSAIEKSNIYFMVMSGFKTDSEEKMNELFRYIKKHKIKLVIIDSLIRIHLGDENSSSDIAKMFGQLRRLSTKGVTVLLNHHHRKKSMGRTYDSQPMRGSSDILAAIDCHMQIEHKDDHLIISQTKNRFGEELKPFVVNIKKEEDKISFDYLGEDNIPHNKSSKAKEMILKLLADKNDWVTRADIDEQLNGKIGKNNIGEALKELVSDEEISFMTSAKGKKKYKLSDNEDSLYDCFLEI
jgi:hypothetical protein